jgi:hypothetical protein
MAGYPVQRGRPPAITRETARRCLRDSGTLSGTSAEEEQMTGKIMPLRERDTSTVQAAADAFLSSPRYANPYTRRSYTGVLDRLLAGLGASRPLTEISGEELAGLLEQLWGRCAPATWNRNRGAVAAWLSWCAASRLPAPVLPAEPPSGRLRPDVLLELGFAESYAADPQAAAHLQAALDIAPATTAQVSITLALGRMLQIGGRNRESLAVFDRTRARLGATDRRAALTLEGAALGAAQMDTQTADDAAHRIARLRRLAEEEPDVPPSVFGPLAVAAANANEPADVGARLALRALDGAPKLLPEAVDRPPFFYHACNALAFAERSPEALPRFDQALADARRLGSLPHVLALSCYRAQARAPSESRCGRPASPTAERAASSCSARRSACWRAPARAWNTPAP